MKRNKKKNSNSMSSKIALITILIIIATVSILSAFTYSAQKKAVDDQLKSDAANNVDQLVSDLNSYNQTVQIVKESLQSNNLKLAKSIRETLLGQDSYSTEELASIANEIGVSEINVMNGQGIMEFSSNPDLIGYKYNSSEQSAPFMEAITNKNFELAQEPSIRGADNKMFMYIGVARQDSEGMFQLGMEPVEYQKVVESVNLQNEVEKNAFAETGFSFIVNAKGLIIAHPQKDLIEKSVTDLSFGDSIGSDQKGDFFYEESGKSKYLAFERTSDGHLIIATVDVDDYLGSLHSLMFKLILCGVIIIIISVLLVLIYTKRNIAKPMGEIQSAMEQIASGNLNQTYNSTRKDEIGQIYIHLNQMANSLKELIGSISNNSDQVAASAEELAASAEQTGKATEQIAFSVQEVAAGTDKQMQSVEDSSVVIGKLASGIQEIADSVEKVTAVTGDTSERADEGTKNIQLAIEQMNTISDTFSDLSGSVKVLGDRSNEINQIVQVITDISSQTNLLALNAAIEAARAGEQGKGFAVVANEVRKLAEQSSNSARQIAQLISAIQEETDKTVQSMDLAAKEVAEGIGVVNSSGESFVKIRHSVNEVGNQIQQVSSSVQQISAATEQVVHSINLISEVAETAADGTQNVSAATQEQLASMEEISASASSLTNMAEELQQAIGKFKI
jgi:methyl-accepting chemotaxis protein